MRRLTTANVLAPATAFLVAVVLAASVSDGDGKTAVPRTARAAIVPADRERAAPPLLLAAVPELPAPLAAPEPPPPRAPAPRPAATPVASPTPAPSSAPAPTPTPAPAPPPPPPAPPAPAPTPAPTFDDAGSGPAFDDEGVSP